MCGIAGIVSRQAIKESDLVAMTDTMAHRGPDGFGYHLDGNLAFGHRRLSIVDLSDHGKQPMTYQDRYVMTYNGEVYNFIELRAELRREGYKFESQTDSEVILAAYDFWGVECLNKFNGMWALVIYDRESQTYFIARDRFGVKPLYYCGLDDGFLFASEPKAIVAHPQYEKGLELDYIKSYLASGPKAYTKITAYRDIFSFPPASYFSGSEEELLDNFAPQKFWNLNWNHSREKYDRIAAKALSEEYYELLKDSVRIRLRADVRIGTALSGGLDSSSIVYLVNQILKEAGSSELQTTFSSVYKDADELYCDESQYINQLAEVLNVSSNQTVPDASEVPVEYPNILKAFDGPGEGAHMSGWVTYRMVQQEGVKVTLDGQGADEILGGYIPYIAPYIADLPLGTLFSEAWPWIKNKGTRSLALRGTFVAVARALVGRRATQIMVDWVSGRNVDIGLNCRLETDVSHILVNLLFYGDRGSMAHSVESRAPFMDYRLIEFLAQVPACYKIHQGWTKYLARLAFDGRLPDEICWRTDKMGWPDPDEVWTANKLKDWFESGLLDLGLPDELEELIKNVKNRGDVSLTDRFRLFSLGKWYSGAFKEDNQVDHR